MEERSADLVVVGGGIVGLAHAWHAARAGLQVVLVERDAHAVGASVRNFGHVCTTAQAGDVLALALEANQDWRALAEDAGFALRPVGTAVLARTAAERAVLEEFADERGRDTVRLLEPEAAADLVGFAPPGLVGAAHLPGDLRVDGPDAIAAIAAHLQRIGVEILWRTNVLGVESGLVRTTRGAIRCAWTVVAVGHDVDRLFPDLADGHRLLRCRLRMLEIDPPGGARIAPAVLTGSSILRYDGLAQQPSAAAVRAELERDTPALLAHDVNLMLTQRPDGRVVVGDTHVRSVVEDPFEDESADELILDEIQRLTGARPVVRRRWRGVYASSAVGPFLVAEPARDVTVASVTTGIGMTTALGLARRVLKNLLVPVR